MSHKSQQNISDAFIYSGFVDSRVRRVAMWVCALRNALTTLNMILFPLKTNGHVYGVNATLKTWTWHTEVLCIAAHY